MDQLLNIFNKFNLKSRQNENIFQIKIIIPETG